MNNLETINQLLNEVQTISESYDRVAEATGENFNIFSVLKMETNEVATHSRFIAELLNPKGDHGQNDEFLKLFIKKFSDLEFNTSNAKVKPEHTIENGRIDIFLKDNFQNIIIIENKIHAGEQEDQLLRYSQAFPKKLYNREIFYLTLYGEQSKVDSSANIEYQIISYDNDIIKWLEECKEKAVDIPILRESISQYINLIKKLTNQNLNKVMNQDIIKRVMKDERSFKAFKTLVQSKNEIFEIIMKETVFPFLREIERRYELKLEIKENFFDKKPYSGFNFRHESLTKKNVKLFFEFQMQNHKELVFGFKYLNKEQKENFNYDDLKENFKNQFGNFSTSKNSPCYIPYKDCKNWENLKHLEKIHYGNFKEDFEDKIKKMLSILE